MRLPWDMKLNEMHMKCTSIMFSFNMHTCPAFSIYSFGLFLFPSFCMCVVGSACLFIGTDQCIFSMLFVPHGRVAKWLERLTAEQNIDGSSRMLGSYLEPTLDNATTFNSLYVRKNVQHHLTSSLDDRIECLGFQRVTGHGHRGCSPNISCRNWSGFIMA